MVTKSVKILCDLHCKWEGEPPRYRLFVNDELFTERTWIWNEFYLEEAVPIEAPPGRYQVRYVLVPGYDNCKFKVRNIRLVHGNNIAVMLTEDVVEIL